MKSFLHILSLWIALTMSVVYAGEPTTGAWKGTIVDAETFEVLGGVQLSLAGNTTVFTTDEMGRFSIPDLVEGTYQVRIYRLGYESLEQKVFFQPDSLGMVKIPLRPMSVEIESITISAQRPGREFEMISQMDLSQRPVLSSQEVLPFIPGVFIAQHAGGGKAEQIFLRGFDIDHGTDLQLSVDGMPVNMVSHAHGQGYSDLHFVIPELIERVDFGKGPYEVEQGNFATAGYADFQLKDRLDENRIKLEVGQYGTTRALAMVKLLPQQPKHHLYVAGEYLATRGYFEAAQNLRRANIWGRYHAQIGASSQLIFTASHFGSNWDASGQIPLRAVESGLITRWGAIDSTEGGQTHRQNAQLQFQHIFADGSLLKQQLYATFYQFELYSNFTFFLEDSLNGDQIRQRENRFLWGGSGSWTKSLQLGRTNAHTTVGWSWREDHVRDNELSRTFGRVFTREAVALGDVYETNASVYLKQQLEWESRWQVVWGLRYDFFRFRYDDALIESKEGAMRSQGMMSPRVQLSYDVSDKMQLYSKVGRGFHSNDSRLIFLEPGRAALAPAWGWDLGAIWKPLPTLWIQTAGWQLYASQELVYVGDEGVIEVSDAARRWGADVSLRWRFLPSWSLTADANYTSARFEDVLPEQSFVPLAPQWSSTGGVRFQPQANFQLNLRYRWLGNRPANEDYSVVAQGYQLLDLSGTYQWRGWEVQLSIENVLNTDWREAQFLTESRLRDEVNSVEEIHFTPGAPVMARIGLSYRW
ncbi:MAG: TonB-dependent receptor [Bacteroidota bacterium]